MWWSYKLQSYLFNKKKTKFKNLRIHITDKKKNVKAKLFSDSFTSLPDTKNKNYFKSIMKIVNNKQIKVIIPGSDEEAEFFSKKKKYFSKKNIFINVSDYSSYKKFISKDRFYRELKHYKIMSAKEWSLINNKKDLVSKINNFIKKKIDFVLKPSKARGGRNVYIFEKNLKKQFSKNFNREKHIPFLRLEKYKLKYLKVNFPMVIMRKLYEPSFDIDILCFKGKLIKHVTRQRIGAQGIKGNIIKRNNLKFEKLSKRIAKIFNLTGLYDLDVMLNKKKNPVVIELNPRISGSLSSSIQAGYNLIDDFISLTLGKKISTNKVAKDILIRR